MSKLIEKTTEKMTAATAVYQELRQDLLKGEFKPGQRLQIDALAERYDVGTNPVREALNRLSSERLVDRHDQRGFFVPPISIDGLRELVKTRCWLETVAVQESIAIATRPGRRISSSPITACRARRGACAARRRATGRQSAIRNGSSDIALSISPSSPIAVRGG